MNSLEKAEISAEIHGIGIRNIRSVDLSYFDRKFGEHKGLCQICSARSTLTTDYLTKNCIVAINHSPYLADMAPCGFYLFGKLHLTIKGKRYADVDAIQKALTAILNAIPKDDLNNHSKIFLIVKIVVFSAKGTISKATNKMFAKENQFFVFL